MAIALTVYDGASCIGGNKIHLDDGKSGAFLDFGKNYGKYSRFYEEFLKNRTTRGIHDLLCLGLVPRLGIYRRDLIPRDVDISGYPVIPVSAVLLSHAHLDHAGNIGLLERSVPVIASPSTLAILKGYQDTGRSGTEADVAYLTPRRPSSEDPLYLETDGREYLGRSFCCTSEPGEELLGFLAKRPAEGMGSKRLVPGRALTTGEIPLPFRIRSFEVDHSIPGSCGFVLEGETTIAYTGDFRLHGKGAGKTREFLSAAKDAAILVIEGTRVSEPYEEEEAVSEARANETCLAAVQCADGLVVADFSSRNFERLEAFGEIARKTGRELVITARDLYQLYALWTADGKERWKGVRVYDEVVKHRKRRWEMEVISKIPEVSYATHREIKESQESFILCFSFYDMNHLLDIEPRGGSYIYSSSEPFSEEMEIDLARLMAWLRHFGMRPCGFSVDFGGGELRVTTERGYHASGHAAGPDLERVIDLLDPDLIVPIHTEHRGWFTERYQNVLIAEEGVRYEL